LLGWPPADGAAYSPQDALDDHPARADKAASIYPIISLMSPYSHTATHRMLAGVHASQAVDRAWSVQTYVNSQTPPCFLAQAEDDTVSDPHNTLIMAAACRQHQVPVSPCRYARGGHGFAMGAPVPRPSSGRRITRAGWTGSNLMAQAPGICFMVVQTGRGTGYCGDYFLHKAARAQNCTRLSPSATWHNKCLSLCGVTPT
jgi:acetyl esterase/lipase